MRNPFKKKKKKEQQGELTATIKTSGGTITARSKEFTSEFHTISKKNENLLPLFCDQRDNYWLNIFEGEIWRSTHDPFLHKHTNWKQLPDHSLRNACMLYRTPWFGIRRLRNYEAGVIYER